MKVSLEFLLDGRQLHPSRPKFVLAQTSILKYKLNIQSTEVLNGSVKTRYIWYSLGGINVLHIVETINGFGHVINQDILGNVTVELNIPHDPLA
jgi:hypothetical protein